MPFFILCFYEQNYKHFLTSLIIKYDYWQLYNILQTLSFKKKNFIEDLMLARHYAKFLVPISEWILMEKQTLKC